MSELRGTSSSFELLAEPIQRWIYRKSWRELRDIQERAIPLILNDGRDVIIAAATAGGKTEAAFLPLLSRLLTMEQSQRGFRILYVSPLKALINDQFRRLDDLCTDLDIPVHRWHGDVSAAAKARARRDPDGVLLITPESLEATFVLRGLEIPALFGALDCVVIDELHALMDSERGIHLRSLLNRLEIAIKRRVRRVGLSATLGDMNLAADYLRPAQADDVTILKSNDGGQELKLQIRGYVVKDATRGGRPGDGENGEVRYQEDNPEKSEKASAVRAISEHLFAKLRGAQNLIFAGSRQNVELYADALRRHSEKHRLPNEFFAHHANLAHDHREFVEERLKRAAEPTTAVCTSTLELGIDIGEVESIAQIGPPFCVAGVRQRLGRSGRRPGKPAIMRMYIEERALEPDTGPLDALRLRLVQSTAMVDLLLEGWCEPPRAHALHLSTLVHQILSVIAQRGGATARMLFHTLCRTGPFFQIDQHLFATLLRHLGDPETALIEQAPDGTLMLGRTGERLVEHYGFYAVFMTPEEYRVVCNGRPLGTLPADFPLVPEMTIIFSGRRWRIEHVLDREKVIEVTADPTGVPPKFGGDAADLHDQIALRMRGVYQDTAIPRYLDEKATHLLAEGRESYGRFGLEASGVLATAEKETLIFPWRGTVATESLALALLSLGLAASPRHIVVEVKNRASEVIDAMTELAYSPPPEALTLARFIGNLRREKFHNFLSDDLLARDAAGSRVNAEIVPAMAMNLIQHAD